MPWQCEHCNIMIDEDDTTCPECQSTKASWTMIAEKTRVFKFSGRGFTVMRGAGERNLPREGTDYTTFDAEDTGYCPCVEKALLLELHEREELPAPQHVTYVRLNPKKKKKDWDVQLGLLFEVQPAEEAVVPVEPIEDFDPKSHHDVQILFVYGPEELPEDLTFPGVVQVVDLSEESETGYAPKVRFKSLRKKAVELPIKPIETFRPAFIYSL